MRVIRNLVLSAIVLLPASCASAPDAELTSAEDAVASAEQAEADVYAAETFQQASQALESARQEIQAQEEKFAFSRSYDRAAELLADAERLATEAAAAVAAGKEEVRQQAEAAQAEAQDALDAAERALRRAPRGKGSMLDLEALRGDLDGAKAAFDAAAADLSEGRFMDALNGFSEAKAEADAVVAEIG